MGDILQFVVKHGYSILFAAAFAHQIGFPIPGPLFLLAAGALSASRKLEFIPSIVLVVVACVLADWFWYEAGRRRGEKVLHFMHRFTRDPDFHDQRAKKTFSQYGPQLLLIAKFVPGLDAIAPPLSGISRTSRFRFLGLDAFGAALYSCAYAGLGYVFHRDLNRAVTYIRTAGTLLATVAVATILVVVIYKTLRRHCSTRESRRQIAQAVAAGNDDEGAATYRLIEGVH